MSTARTLYVVPALGGVKREEASTRLSPADEAAARLGTLLEEEAFEEANAWAEQVARKFPVSAKLRMAIGHMYLATGRAPQAIMEFQRALQLDRRLHEAELGLGCALSEMGHNEKAQLHLQRALAALEALPIEVRQKVIGSPAAKPRSVQKKPFSPKPVLKVAPKKTGQRDFIVGALCGFHFAADNAAAYFGDGDRLDRTIAII